MRTYKRAGTGCGRSVDRILLVLLIFFFAGRTVCTAAAATAAGGAIRLNTIGFLPGQTKRATVAAPCSSFSVVDDASGQTAFQGKPSGPVRNDDTGEDLYTADFSTLRRPGAYHLEVPGLGRSPSFRIADDVYDAAFSTAVRAMYLWRCGAAVHAVHNGITYAHGACHLEDAWLDAVGGGHARRAATGGWHDAGDYNKYVVNAGFTVGVMLVAWEQFGSRIRPIALGPENRDKRFPDYLTEIKWELDWLLSMQAADGSVYHKVSTRGFGPAIPPEEEKTDRFLTPWSSAATADFVAMMAKAARVYRPFDQEYSRRCLEAARRSYAFLASHPDNHPADLSGFTTGAYQTADGDDRLWAAAEMWETTGDADALRDAESRARSAPKKFEANWGWGNVNPLGLLTYLFSERAGRDGALLSAIKDNLLAAADAIVRVRDAHGYARPLGSVYYWGCNGGVASTTVLSQAAYRLTQKPEYLDSALDALGHLFGRNYYGRSFVTGLGAGPPEHPHDRRSMGTIGGTPGAPAWPGYLVGGGWPKATDWKDEAARYQVNEIAINWNAALIYALAGFISETPAPVGRTRRRS